MTFQIHALDYRQFSELFNLDDAELRSRNAMRMVANAHPGFPCRVSLEDASIGERLILVNYRHLDVPSPYSAAHAIFVRENAKKATPEPGTVPDVLAQRLLSVRAFDQRGLMVGADAIDGSDLKAALEGFFDKLEIQFVDIHNAKPGCFAARSTRAYGNAKY